MENPIEKDGVQTEADASQKSKFSIDRINLVIIGCLLITTTLLLWIVINPGAEKPDSAAEKKPLSVQQPASTLPVETDPVDKPSVAQAANQDQNTATSLVQEVNPSSATATAYQEKVINNLERISFRKQSFEYYIMNASSRSAALYYGDENGKPLKTFSAAIKASKANDDKPVFITNGGIFHENLKPVGLLVENGKERFPINLEDGNGNFFLKPNGVFFKRNDGSFGVKESEVFAKKEKEILFATQSGPILLNEGAIHPKFNEGSSNLRLRSGVGIMPSGNVVFIISKQRVNFYDFALLFKNEFGCKNALYLDGEISKMHEIKAKGAAPEGVFSNWIIVSGN